MRLLKFTLMSVQLIFVAVVLAACDKHNKKGDFIETPAEKPTGFYDSFGELWTCIESEDAASITGKVNFTQPVSLNRDDLLHISLLKISSDDSIEPIATRCMNNLLGLPIEYSITYNPELIDSEARYVLSSVLFISVEGETFLAAYEPDGFLEVIKNGVVKAADADLFLIVP
jgi:uncharacterized lipoprotein YbaY